MRAPRAHHEASGPGTAVEVEQGVALLEPRRIGRELEESLGLAGVGLEEGVRRDRETHPADLVVDPSGAVEDVLGLSVRDGRLRRRDVLNEGRDLGVPLEQSRHERGSMSSCARSEVTRSTMSSPVRSPRRTTRWRSRRCDRAGPRASSISARQLPRVRTSSLAPSKAMSQCSMSRTFWKSPGACRPRPKEASTPSGSSGST